jgi:hypothetical protein
MEHGTFKQMLQSSSFEIVGLPKHITNIEVLNPSKNPVTPATPAKRPRMSKSWPFLCEPFPIYSS